MDSPRLDFRLVHRKEIENSAQDFRPYVSEPLKKLLKRAKGRNVDDVTATTLKKINGDYLICKRITIAPRRFQLTVETIDLKSDYHMQVRTVFINGRAAVNMVEKATHFLYGVIST